MKKNILIIVTVVIATCAQAQININKPRSVEVTNYEVTDNAFKLTQPVKTVTRPETNEKNVGVTLGTTYYDLQTNSAVQDRIVMNGNGDISAAWTASEENSTSFSDRGTGYAHRDPGTGEWTLSPNYPRIENERCGWASMLYDGNGGELIVSHTTTAALNLKLNKRPSIGTGNWTQKDVSSTKLWWNRAAMGGNDGNTLHIIAATDTAAYANHQNMYRAIVYYRSQDAGSTFDKVDVILPGIDSAAYGTSGPSFNKGTLSTDAYAIAAKGNTVAFAIFNKWNDIILMKSTNNGDSWTKTIVSDFPYKNFYELDNLCDSSHRHITSDNSGAILIDATGKVHLTWGRIIVRNNDVVGDEFFYLTSWVDSLGYWNESMGANNPSTCGYYIDKNNNGLFDFTTVGDYFQGGWLSYPNMSLGSDGSIYTVYSAVSEDTVWASDGGTAMRHIYLVRSKDGGTTWGEPTDLTPYDPDLSESVYPDMVSTTDNNIRLIYQHDWHPSIYVSQIGASPSPQNYTRQTQATENEIVYLEIDTSLTIGIENVISGIGETGVFPNPSDGIVNLSINVYKDVNVRVSVSNLSGQVVYRYQKSILKPGRNLIDMNLSSLEPGIYFLNVNAEGSIMSEKLILK